MTRQAHPTAWENAALDVLEQHGRPASPDPVRLALAMGLSLAPTVRREGGCVARVILVAPELDGEAFRVCVANGIARWFIRSAGVEESSDAVQAFARVLLNPSYDRPNPADGQVLRLRLPRSHAGAG